MKNIEQRRLDERSFDESHSKRHKREERINVRLYNWASGVLTVEEFLGPTEGRHFSSLQAGILFAQELNAKFGHHLKVYDGDDICAHFCDKTVDTYA